MIVLFSVRCLAVTTLFSFTLVSGKFPCAPLVLWVHVWHVCDFLLQAVSNYRVSTDTVKIKRHITAAGLQYLSSALVKKLRQVSSDFRIIPSMCLNAAFIKSPLIRVYLLPTTVHDELWRVSRFPQAEAITCNSVQYHEAVRKNSAQ